MLLNTRISSNIPTCSRLLTHSSRREIMLAFASVPLQKRHHHHHDPTSKPSSEIKPQENVLDSHHLSQADKAKMKEELSQEQRYRSQQWQREFIEAASGLE